MKELMRAKRAWECDWDGEYDVDEAEEVMQCFGGKEEMCEDEDEGDMLWELTMKLCKEWKQTTREE